MKNQDINSRFQDWLLNPSEGLDFEVKGWLDMTDQDHRGTIAKALIALENHGGGLLLIGYSENEAGKLVPEQPRPASLAAYTTDEFNDIVKRYAEPSFHVDLTIQKHPETSEEFPLIAVHGSSKVPVRSYRASPNNSIRKDCYYVRRPGPASETPQDGSEWDKLIRRCVLNQREDIISVLRNFGLATIAVPNPGPPSPDSLQLLTNFSNECQARWSALNEGLHVEHPSRIKLGNFSFAAKIEGEKRNLNAKNVLELLERGRRYTGWPAFVTLHSEENKPRLIDKGLQAWLALLKYPDVAHADFWRICLDGHFFLLRGMQEDALDEPKFKGKEGTLFEATLPIWRLGEYLLRVHYIASEMFEPGFKITVMCKWTGLKNRHLFVHRGHRYIPSYTTIEDTVETNGQFDGDAIRDLLPDTVKALTLPLYESFELFQPPDEMFISELSDMTKNNF